MHSEETKGDCHELKILPEYYKDILNDTKTFEIRKFDRDYKVNDILLLKEWTPKGGYTGNWITRKISYIFNNNAYCKEGYVVLGIKSDY